MSYPPPPPPPGAPGHGPPPGAPGYGPPPGAPGYGPPPGAPGYGPPTGPPPPGAPGGYGPPPGAPPGYGGPPSGGGSSGSSKGPLIALMSALVVVVLIAVVGGLVLLSRSGGGDVELTEAQLEEALLTEGDVGDDFTVDTAGEEGEDDEFDIDELDASDECLDLITELEESGTELFGGGNADVEAGIEFDGTEGEQVEHTLSQGEDADLGLVREVVDTCGEIDIDDGESIGTITFEIVDDVVELGDDSLTLELTVELTEPFAITGVSLGVLWERSGTFASVTTSGAVDPDTFETDDPDERFLEDLVTRADEKLQEVIDEA